MIRHCILVGYKVIRSQQQQQKRQYARLFHSMEVSEKYLNKLTRV